MEYGTPLPSKFSAFQYFILFLYLFIFIYIIIIISVWPDLNIARNLVPHDLFWSYRSVKIYKRGGIYPPNFSGQNYYSLLKRHI